MNHKRPVCIYSLVRNMLLMAITVTAVVITLRALPLLLGA